MFTPGDPPLPEPTQMLGVVVGEHDWTDTSHGKVYLVKCKHVHHRYDPFGDTAWDIAILTLKRRIAFGRKQQPACLPPPRWFGDRYLGGKNLLVSGWGHLEDGGWGPDVLHSVEVPFVPWWQCKQLFEEGWITRIMMCAGNVDDGGVDSCQGDSGGITKILLILAEGKWITYSN